jgi:hypothetical protein
MNYLTNYYKNRCTQLQEQVNRLSNRIRLLSEASDVAAQEQESNPYMPPPWHAPEFNPNQPTSPQPPMNVDEWYQNNPKPNPANYPDGPDDPDYKKDLDKWYDAYQRAKENYHAWMRNQRGINRGNGRFNQDPDPWHQGVEAPLPPWFP